MEQASNGIRSKPRIIVPERKKKNFFPSLFFLLSDSPDFDMCALAANPIHECERGGSTAKWQTRQMRASGCSVPSGSL